MSVVYKLQIVNPRHRKARSARPIAITPRPTRPGWTKSRTGFRASPIQGPSRRSPARPPFSCRGVLSGTAICDWHHLSSTKAGMRPSVCPSTRPA